MDDDLFLIVFNPKKPVEVKTIVSLKLINLYRNIKLLYQNLSFYKLEMKHLIELLRKKTF